MFKVNDRVTLINRDDIHGVINTVKQSGIITYYGIMLDSGDLVTEMEGNIRYKVENPSPIDLFRQRNYETKEEYLVRTVINKMFGNNNDIIATLKSSKTTFLPYQFKPLSKFLKSENRRLLIADEVGLGKTIEAGYILTELFLRDQVKNCLIICKASLKEKWQTELKQKFGFDFKIYNRQELISKIKEDSKVGQKGIFGIINYDFKEKASQEILELMQNEHYYFDMLIVDEAHILRNEETIKHKAIKKILETTVNCIFLTATPVMTSLKNLYSLVKILEPKYDNYKDPKQNMDFGYSLFMDHLELSNPFIDALNKINLGVSPKKVISDLINKEITLKYTLLDDSYSYSHVVKLTDRFKNDILFQSVINMNKINDFRASDIALLQKKLADLNSFQDIITRTRRREVQTNIKTVTRRAEKIPVNFTKTEMDLYESILFDFEDTPLKLVTRKRQATSCLPVYIQKYISNESHSSIDFEDSKFKEFRKIVDKVVVKNGKKLIVFSFFKDTLRYLETLLNANNIQTLKIDGDTPISNRQEQVDKFKLSTNPLVLLSSEVGSEGLDMQFCDALVNYDLPWNPMVVEQRIGRIDRIGQTSDVIHIYNLCIQNTIEDQIFERLLNRIHIFDQSIGGLEDILCSDESIFSTNEGLESIIYGYKLSPEAIEQKMREIEVAIEQAELTRKQIQENLEDSFLNEQYINEEIDSINKQKKYITQDDIRALMKLLFQSRLSSLGCNLEQANPYIRWSSGDHGLFDFIEQNIPSRINNPQLFLKYVDFKSRYIKKSAVDITFDQEEAYQNRFVEFISASHPLTQAAFNYFNSKNKSVKNAFSFCIQKEFSPNGLDNNTIYFLAKYKLTYIKFSMAFREPDKSSQELILCFKLLENNSLEELNTEQSQLLNSIEIDKWFANFEQNPNQEEAFHLMELLEPLLMHTFFSKKMKLEEEFKNSYLSRQYRLIDTEIDFLNRQIERAQNIFKENSDNSIRFIYKEQIERYNEKIEKLNSQKKNVKVFINDDFQSLTLIQFV